MKRLKVTFTGKDPLDDAHYQSLLDHIAHIKQDIKKGYDSAFAFAHVIEDKAMLANVLTLTKEKQKLHPSMLIVVGIGGSNLGTMAVAQSLFGRFYNDLDPATQLYYADTVDTDYMHSLLAIAEATLLNGKQVMVNLVSKSGKTTETIANFELLLALLKKYRPQNYAEYIVVTTDENSALWQLAQKAHWATLAIPAQVGGRFSVLSPVGLFPLAMLDVDIEGLLEGAKDMQDVCLRDGANPAAQSATWQYGLLQDDYTISNLFVFSNELCAVGKWWRQLMGESLGKAQKKDGNKNDQTLMPIVSIGSTDLHSVGQLYLSGVLKVMTQFVVVEQDLFQEVIPNYREYFDQLVPHIQNKSLSNIMHAIIAGVQKAYAKKGLPYCTIALPERSAQVIGQFLQYKMFEICYLGYLLQVNPFDQPEVELYKTETREILAHE